MRSYSGFVPRSPKRGTKAKPGSKQKIAVLRRRAKARMDLHHPDDNRSQPPFWEAFVTVEGRAQRFEVQAWTKSEARAKVKEKLELGKKDRLPAGTEVKKLGGGDVTTEDGS